MTVILYIVGTPNLATAVALMDVGVNSGYKGVVRFVQVDDSTCVIDGTLDGFAPGNYGVYLHEYGDISDGCTRLVVCIAAGSYGVKCDIFLNSDGCLILVCWHGLKSLNIYYNDNN